MPLTSGADDLHACIRATGGHFEYSLGRKLVKTFKLISSLLLNKTYLPHYRHFPDIYV